MRSQRSDALRYLLLLVEGGIYSDTDTRLLKSPSHWGEGPMLWRNGAGWMTEEQIKLLAAGSDIDTVLGKPSIVVGIEADVGGRADWFDWWPRPVSLVWRLYASALILHRYRLSNGRWLQLPTIRSHCRQFCAYCTQQQRRSTGPTSTHSMSKPSGHWVGTTTCSRSTRQRYSKNRRLEGLLVSWRGQDLELGQMRY